MATTLAAFRPAPTRASSSSSRKPEPNRRKPGSLNWWTPLFGWSSDPDYVDSASDSTPHTHATPDPESESVRGRSRFNPGCFTEEKAKQLRKKTRESSSFHDIMYHSAIASRLATDLSELSEK